MEQGKVLIDAAAYMLFEATDDSDAQCFDGAIEMDSGEAEDDALSCSFGSACGGAWWNQAVDAGGDDSRDAEFGDEDEDQDAGASSDEEDGVVDQCRRRRAAAPAWEKPVKSKGCDDSNAKMMNERERDRQFWEACLAS